MDRSQDPRLDVTRSHALDAALVLLQEKGVTAVTHGAIGTLTGISRSTLYRHWPTLNDLRNAAFARAATGENKGSNSDEPPTDSTLRTDLLWMMEKLANALSETPWGKIAPQVIGAAATDEQTRELLENWFENRKSNVRRVFETARARREIGDGAPVEQLVEMAIAVPYFRKLVSGLPLSPEWLEAHVCMICSLAAKSTNA